MTLSDYGHIISEVAKREIRMLLHRPFYIFSTIVVMIFSCIFFTSLLSSGAPRKMPIAIVDMDQSTISRRVMHELEGTPSVTIKRVTMDFATAREALQRGEVYAILLIPERFYADLASMKRPTMTFYVNNAYTMAGSTAYSQLFTLMNLASGAFQREVLRKKGMPDDLIMKRVQPVAIDTHLLANPWSNYAVYLLAVILPGILGVIILMITIYSIGSELKWKTSREWLAVGGDNFALSMIGKLLPHTILYTILGISLNILMFRILDFPVMGSLLWLNVGMFLYVLAMEGLAICFIGLVPVLRDALSVGALIGMLSFSLSGFTFPAMGMLSWAQSIIYLFPLRHYYLIYVNEALMGAPITTSAVYMSAYVGFMILPFLVGKRLENALRLQNYPRD